MIHYMTSEWCGSGSLELEIKQSVERFPEQDLLEMYAKLAIALDYTHKAGLIHRNISSAHVYNNRLGGHVPLCLRQAMEKRLKTKMYLEHYYLKEEGGEYDRKADLYALGVLFLEAATLDKKPIYEPEERKMGAPCGDRIEENRVKMRENYPLYLCNIVDALL